MNTIKVSNTKESLIINIALIFSAIIPQFAMNMVAPVLPQLGQYFQTEASSLQFVITIYLFGYALSMLLSGILSEMFGAKKVQLWGIFFFCVSSIACTQVNSFYMLVILRFVQAFCGCGITVLSRLIIQEVYPTQKHVGIVTSLALAVSLSPSIAPVIGGTLVEVSDWKTIFLFLSLMGLISFCLFVFFIPSSDKPKAQNFNFSVLIAELKIGVTNSNFRRYLTSISLVSMGQIAFLANSSYPMQEQIGVSASKYGVLLAITAIGFVVGTQVARISIQRIGIIPVLLVAGSVSFLSGILMILASYIWPMSPLSLIIPMFGVMLSVGIVVPTSQAGLLRIPSSHPGYLASFFFFGQIALSTIYGISTKSLNFDILILSIVIAAPCLLLGILSAFWYISNQSALSIPSKAYSNQDI